MKKRKRIIKKMKSWCWRTNHKFGFELPHDVARALAIDKITGTA
jgi:hypothetical protein